MSPIPGRLCPSPHGVNRFSSIRSWVHFWNPNSVCSMETGIGMKYSCRRRCPTTSGAPPHPRSVAAPTLRPGIDLHQEALDRQGEKAQRQRHKSTSGGMTRLGCGALVRTAVRLATRLTSCVAAPKRQPCHDVQGQPSSINSSNRTDDLRGIIVYQRFRSLMTLPGRRLFLLRLRRR